MNKNYDIIVVGAGTAGCIAAIQCARSGAKTLLIEKNATPGGTMTIGQVAFPGLFHAWGKQVIGGIGWEMVEKCVMENNETLPDFSRYDLPHWHLQIKINPFLYECIIDEEFNRAGVDVLYHAIPSRFKEHDDYIELEVCCKQGVHTVSAKKVIDATADANIVSLAGYTVLFNQEKQPATPMLHIDGCEMDKLDCDYIDHKFHEMVAEGKMLETDIGTSGKMSGFLKKHGRNAVHIPMDDASGSDSKTNVEMRAREAVLRIYRFLKQFDGLEKLKINSMAQECGIRESAVIKGRKCITVQDYTNGTVFDDSICYSFYPIDLHLNSAEGLDCRPLSRGVVPTIPLAAMIPEQSRHIIIAGRCVSSDQLANSALRVQASCMAMGQGAACAAVIAVTNNCDIADVNISKVKILLKKHNAIVP